MDTPRCSVPRSPSLKKRHRFTYSIRRTFKRKKRTKRAYTSYEKLVGDKDIRRGSVPAVPAAVDEDSVMMDTTPSTPSRFTNFLIRKGFKSNLKRTTSSTKLDRKRAAAASPDVDNTFVGTLKRTMSLGRLARKRTRSKSTDLDNQKSHHQSLSVISSRLKSSQSHESLLSTHSPLHSIDLTSPDMEIKPLHPSILNQEHCFQVSTSHGNKYISCRTPEEREKWIQSLRRTIHPQQENSRRTESTLKVWVQEAKNVPSKKRYFCEICLDKTLYARTSIKMKGDMLFWGEQFEFNNLPSVEFLIVNLYREADKKKKKERGNTTVLVGYSKIPIADITNRQYVERWFTTSSGTVGKTGKEIKTDLPLMRLKVRHMTVQILPIDLYKDMSQYLKESYVPLCNTLEPLVSIKDKEEIAKTLIKIMQKLNKSKEFLSEVVMAEVLRLDNNHLLFRGNSIATKSIEAYMKLVGEKYLNDTLGDFVRTIITTEDDCEVDPTKVPIPSMLPSNQMNLRMFCDMAWSKIITSFSFFPSELREVFASFRGQCEEREKGDLSDNLISASIFLRFLCPAILSPSLFHLTQEFPSDKAARNLTLIAKTIQTLANFSKFESKEEYMTFMNDFVDAEWCNMKEFLHKISSSEKSDTFTEFDGHIDLGMEMSMLHTLLSDTLEKASEENLTKLQPLPKILGQISTDLKDPNISQRKPSKRHSQHYDNLVNIQAHIDHNTSPTELLRDMLRQCGESTEDMPVVTNGDKECGVNGDSRKSSLDKTTSDLSLNEDDSLNQGTGDVANVCVSSRSVTKSQVNQSWDRIVTAAELVNGEYIDLITFMDEDTTGNNSSMEMDANVNGSQMSVSQVSTVASSGYQSFGYSQSSSPIDNNNHEGPHEPPKSPNNNTYTHSTPLSFSNPMYRHYHRGITSQVKTSSPIPQASSNSSLSSEEAQTVKNVSPVKFELSERHSLTSTPSGTIRKKVVSVSSSSSSDSVPEKERLHQSYSTNSMSLSMHSDLDNPSWGPRHSQSNNNMYSVTLETPDRPRHSKSNNNVCASSKDFVTSDKGSAIIGNTRKYPKELRASSPLLSHSSAHSNMKPNHNGNYSNTIGSTSRRHPELSQSVDLSYASQRYSDQLRRTATDTIISQRSCSPAYSEGSNTSSSVPASPGDHMSSEESSLFRRLTAQNAVHMGIRSVQRRIHEQEKTKQEYECEVNVLKQQLEEAQERLKMAEERLQEHETETEQISSDWQVRLEESEERMRKQQAEKDDQMKNIIQSASNQSLSKQPLDGD